MFETHTPLIEWRYVAVAGAHALCESIQLPTIGTRFEDFANEEAEAGVWWLQIVE